MAENTSIFKTSEVEDSHPNKKNFAQMGAALTQGFPFEQLTLLADQDAKKQIDTLRSLEIAVGFTELTTLLVTVGAQLESFTRITNALGNLLAKPETIGQLGNFQNPETFFAWAGITMILGTIGVIGVEFDVPRLRENHGGHIDELNTAHLILDRPEGRPSPIEVLMTEMQACHTGEHTFPEAWSDIAERELAPQIKRPYDMLLTWANSIGTAIKSAETDPKKARWNRKWDSQTETLVESTCKAYEALYQLDLLRDPRLNGITPEKAVQNSACLALNHVCGYTNTRLTAASETHPDLDTIEGTATAISEYTGPDTLAPAQDLLEYYTYPNDFDRDKAAAQTRELYNSMKDLLEANAQLDAADQKLDREYEIAKRNAPSDPKEKQEYLSQIESVKSFGKMSNSLARAANTTAFAAAQKAADNFNELTHLTSWQARYATLADLQKPQKLEAEIKAYYHMT